jgi:hypothetical protein
MARLRKQTTPPHDRSAAWRAVGAMATRRYALAHNMEASSRFRALEERREYYTYGAGSPNDLDPTWHRFGSDEDKLGPLTRAEAAELAALAELGDRFRRQEAA